MYARIKGVLEQLLETQIVLEHPKDKSLGHYASVVAFSLAKTRKKAPKLLALEIVEFLQEQEACQELFARIEALNGYINFTLKESFLDSLCTQALALGCDFGRGVSKESLYVEFVSANPTGPLHIGHARGAIFGDSLCRLGRFLGVKTHAEYYVNDMGAQIKMLGLSVLLTIQEMQGMEVQFPKGAYDAKELAPRALEHFGHLEGTQEELIAKLGDFAKDCLLGRIQQSLQDMGVQMDAYVSEKAMFSAQEAIFARLQKAGGVYEKEGKMWLASSMHGDEKDRVLKKSDGSFTYIAGDIAYHDYKFAQRYDHYINIFGADHHGYVARIKAALEFLGYESQRLEVLLTQMVALLKEGKPYKMSKREGNVVLLEEALQDMGKDALRFVFLSKKLDTHWEFDIANLQHQDSTNPIFYIHYANARIHTMLAKFLQRGEARAIAQSHLENLPPPSKTPAI